MSNQNMSYCHKCERRMPDGHTHYKDKNKNMSSGLPTRKDKARNRRFLKGWS